MYNYQKFLALHCDLVSCEKHFSILNSSYKLWSFTNPKLHQLRSNFVSSQPLVQSQNQGKAQSPWEKLLNQWLFKEKSHFHCVIILTAGWTSQQGFCFFWKVKADSQSLRTMEGRTIGPSNCIYPVEENLFLNGWDLHWSYYGGLWDPMDACYTLFSFNQFHQLSMSISWPKNKKQHFKQKMVPK